ncbi:fasciclin domain-containing protein [Dokdonia ponticola]|uniref:Fasciclin domain-containing protein n=1 Tax=Dokdonia ponticola TaxID=2041041 RepID=A0ABV9HQ72_9FLAO
MKKILLLLACLSLSFLSFTIKDNEELIIHQDKNLVEVALENGSFSTLLSAVKAAELEWILLGENQFTVFAPSNAAFDNLQNGTLDSLSKLENKDALADLLMYHVIAGKYKASDIIKAIKDNDGVFAVDTIKGEKITLTMDNGNVVIEDAKGGESVIIMTDVDASNGVIHAIDHVLMPK